MFGSSLPPGVCRRARVLFYDNGYVPLVVNTFRFSPHSRLVFGVLTRLTRPVLLVEQELLTLPENLITYFILAIVLFVLLRYTDSNYPLVSSNSSNVICVYLHIVVSNICVVFRFYLSSYFVLYVQWCLLLWIVYSPTFIWTKDSTLFSIFHLCSCLLVTV
jgi:hypothetical protein